MLFQHPEIISDLKDGMSGSNHGSPSYPAMRGSGRYDTDPLNDLYIAGQLDNKQLKQLDEVLKYDKAVGQPLSRTMLNRLSGNDKKIEQAYERFLRCKNLMRSTNKVIYPDER